jgi:hypothetical protein
MTTPEDLLMVKEKLSGVFWAREIFKPMYG